MTDTRDADLYKFVTEHKQEGENNILKAFKTVPDYLAYKGKALDIVEFLEMFYPEHVLLKEVKNNILKDSHFNLVISVLPSENPLIEANKKSRIRGYKKTLEEMSALVAGALSWDYLTEDNYGLELIFVHIKPEYTSLAIDNIHNILDSEGESADDEDEIDPEILRLN